MTSRAGAEGNSQASGLDLGLDLVGRQSWGKWVQAVVKMWKAAGLLAWASLSLE